MHYFSLWLLLITMPWWPHYGDILGLIYGLRWCPDHEITILSSYYCRASNLCTMVIVHIWNLATLITFTIVHLFILCYVYTTLCSHHFSAIYYLDILLPYFYTTNIFYFNSECSYLIIVFSMHYLAKCYFIHFQNYLLPLHPKM